MCAAVAPDAKVSFLYQLRNPDKLSELQILRLDEETGAICAMDEPPLQLPFDYFKPLDERTLWGEIKSDDKRELGIYTVDAKTGRLNEIQRIDITALKGQVGAFSRDLRFFYTMSELPLDELSISVDLHSYEFENGSFVERGTRNMGITYNEPPVSYAAWISGLSADGRWLLVRDGTMFPHGGSGSIYAFPIDETTGAALSRDSVLWYCCDDDTWASSASFTRDSHYMVVLDNEYERQRLRTFALVEPRPTEVSDSPVTFSEDWMSHPALMEAGPTTYALLAGEKFSEWKVSEEGSWNELAETTTPNTPGQYEASFVFTHSGRVMLQLENYPPANAPTIITHLHQGPAKLERKHAYRLEGYSAGIFEAGE